MGILKSSKPGVEYCILLIVLLGCGESNIKNDDAKRVTNKDSIQENRIAVVAEPLSFLDSVSMQYELNFGQVRNHTQLDSGMFTGNASFSGDTVYKANAGNVVAILRYNDGMVCTHKILLVFNGEQNTDHKLVQSDCDIDLSWESYQAIHLQVLTGSTFCINEVTYNQVPGTEEYKSERVTRHFWLINSNGLLINSDSLVIDQ